MTESTIDFPKETLCPDIWDNVLDANGIKHVWVLKPEVGAQLLTVANKIIEMSKLNPEKLIVHITGSITSNCYTKNADIDMHFLFKEGYAIREMSKVTQNRFSKAAKTLKEQEPNLMIIGTHPIEIYFQPDEFQDYMSVGCYNLTKMKWEVGPEMTDQTYNPYSDLYKEIWSKSEKYAQKIRNMIFSIYEIAIVYKKNLGTEYASSIRPILLDRLENIQELYDSVREMRKSYSSPKSKEEALKNRSNRKWKIVDASFKLFDKYGYLAIMKKFIEDYELISNSNDVDLEIVNDILDTVKNYINNADKLSEKEIFENEEQVNEGPLQNGLLIALLAIPGLIPEQALAKELNNIPKTEMRFSSPKVQQAMDNATTIKKDINGLSYKNTVNLVATIIYNETMIDWLKTKDDKILTALAQLIYNRAGGDINHITDEIKRQSQFYSLKHVRGGFDNASYKTYDPHLEGRISKSQENCWKKCEQTALAMLEGKLENVIGDRNMLANRKLDKASALKAWGNTCDLKIGSQYYGYTKDQDGYRKYKTDKPVELTHALPSTDKNNIYIVKAGDTGFGIAKKLHMNFVDLQKKNQKIDLDNIKPGQKIVV